LEKYYLGSALDGTIGKIKSFGGQTAMAAIVGGTTAKLGGGKFANGAVSGAFVHMFNAEGLTMKQSFSKLWSKITDGTIMNDAGKGLRGGLDAYRAVRDNRNGNVPLIARGMLRVSITSVELGLTSWIKDPLLYIYVNVNSGFLLDTIPLNRIAIPANLVSGYAK